MPQSTPDECPPERQPLELLARRRAEEYYWVWVLCLLGLDYFSTLAYQPSITYELTGRLGPIATLIVVLVTLLGALPIYWYLAGRSPRGDGSLGLLERLVHGWRGKTLVLIVLGFAATDFTMLKAISLADASVHLLDNPLFRGQEVRDAVAWINEQYPSPIDGTPILTSQLAVTLVLGVVGFLFWFILRKGFNRNVLYVSVPLIGAYLALNGLLLGAGIGRLVDRPELVATWIAQVQAGDWIISAPFWAHDDWRSIVALSFLFLPSVALGLSGFELSMIIMPQVKGKAGEPANQPATRIRHTRKVLATAALIMSVYLLAAVVVATLFIPPEEFKPAPATAPDQGGHAVNRALSYLAHGGRIVDGHDPLAPFCGIAFGTAYDVVTILVLCLAGTSVMTALAVLLPQFLLRFGMEFRWADRWGLLLGAFAFINLLVTLIFQAHVEDQRGAYATGVLALITSAGVASALDKRREMRDKHHGLVGRFFARINLGYYTAFAALFVLTAISVMLQTPSGLGITLCFIAAIVAMSVISRAWRADELRTIGFEFKDDESKFLWDSMRAADFPVLVPHRPGHQSRAEKEAEIRAHHQLAPEVDIVFLEVEMGDPSDFYQRLLVAVFREDTRVIIKLHNCVAVPHAIAAVALEMSRDSIPPGLHFGWTQLDMLSASWSYLAFGEGNVPWKVRELIHRAEKDPAKRPRVIIG
jgi:hypothetical protein